MDVGLSAAVGVSIAWLHLRDAGSCSSSTIERVAALDRARFKDAKTVKRALHCCLGKSERAGDNLYIYTPLALQLGLQFHSVPPRRATQARPVDGLATGCKTLVLLLSGP